MMKIDSHIHFWKYHPIKDAWITDEMEVLKSDYMPDDLLHQMNDAGIEQGILVQADQSEKENYFLLTLAKQHPSFVAVVGWVDFRSNNIEERLAFYAEDNLMKGFRHIVQSEPDLNFLLKPSFMNGIALLKKYNFTYDVLIYPKHLEIALEFCKTFSDQKLIIDHIGKPDIKNRNFTDWKKEISEFKSMDHVGCKLAGLVTEADWNRWQVDDFKEVIDFCLSVFGPHRMMFGSDWPVCKLGGSYAEVCAIVEQHISKLTEVEQAAIWGNTCRDFYNIKP
ncbi:amidohydrolase [Sphingobacterium sp. BN32]|uniref:amidohydrolase family protein n=1 Tax=Sphingobacterium sp. BN32 TaxID=3058432 RepID=UPI00265CEF41|nr:amidohydrolase family protein [Sphingobacterium sp. BN32]WKK57800.1 amidohydrolase family protein [Sphingobacterium sp. BN32]